MSIARGREIAGRKAIVTGAASGIGAATVARLVADGCMVLAVDKSAHGLAGTANLVADLATPDAPATVARHVRDVFGGLDILFNNAGVCPSSPVEEMTDQVWEETLTINVTAVMKLTRACLPLLRASRAGRIINTGSILSRFGDAGLAAYTTSKHAVLGLTRALATELGPSGVTVNCIQPGAIVTGMTRPLFDGSPDAVAYYAGRSPLGRLGQPEDIADVVSFLASDDARFITGQGLLVDGGVMVHS